MTAKLWSPKNRWSIGFITAQITSRIIAPGAIRHYLDVGGVEPAEATCIKRWEVSSRHALCITFSAHSYFVVVDLIGLRRCPIGNGTIFYSTKPAVTAIVIHADPHIGLRSLKNSALGSIAAASFIE